MTPDDLLALDAIEIANGDVYQAAAFLVNTRGNRFSDRPTGYVAQELKALIESEAA